MFNAVATPMGVSHENEVPPDNQASIQVPPRHSRGGFKSKNRTTLAVYEHRTPCYSSAGAPKKSLGKATLRFTRGLSPIGMSTNNTPVASHIQAPASGHGVLVGNKYEIFQRNQVNTWPALVIKTRRLQDTSISGNHRQQ